MTTLNMLTKEEVLPLLTEVIEQHRDTFNRWLSRGDGIAIYENKAMDSHGAGHMQFISFGSSQAQIEAVEPPLRMPDIGAQINWQYQLIGVYQGECL